MYIQKLSFTEAETTLLAHAKALVKSAPTETTNLLMTICTPKGTHHYFCCVVCVLFCPLGCTDPPPTPHHHHQVAENGAAAKNNTKTKKNNECAATPKRICRHSWITAATGTTNSPINWNCDGKTNNDENNAHIAHIAYIDSLTHHQPLSATPPDFYGTSWRRIQPLSKCGTRCWSCVFTVLSKTQRKATREVPLQRKRS